MMILRERGERWKMISIVCYYCSFDRFMISFIVCIIFVVAAECNLCVEGCKREKERAGSRSLKAATVVVHPATILSRYLNLRFTLTISLKVSDTSLLHVNKGGGKSSKHYKKNSNSVDCSSINLNGVQPAERKIEIYGHFVKIKHKQVKKKN